MICIVAVLLAFAEEVSVSSKSVLQECVTRVPSKKCQVRVSYKSVK